MTSDSENENEIFNTSTKVLRSPPKPPGAKTGYPTRSQTKNNTPTSSKQVTEPKPIKITQTTDQQTQIQKSLSIPITQTTDQQIQKQKAINVPIPQVLKSTDVPVPQTTVLTPTRVAPKPHKMQAREMQKDIKTFIPEFSGEDTINRAKELTRFLGTADSLYKTLTLQDDKDTFCRLIKFRLTGEAFARINYREINDYETLKTVLNNMYATRITLNDMEREYTNIQQTYGETIRNYGYRLMEALEQYKRGYQTKYNLPKIDDTYLKHLETNASQVFKRGLNNTILKEKIATNTADTLDKLITETETIERMLELSTSYTTQNKPTEHIHTTKQLPINQFSNNQIICNYCHKPNHTWDRCRERIRNTTQNQRNPPYNQYVRPQNSNETYRRHAPIIPQHNGNQMQYRRNNGPTNGLSPQRQPQQQQNYHPPKYCSHCKIRGHTFEECRSKFLGTRMYNTSDNSSQQKITEDTGLENLFNNMRINQITPQSYHQQQISTNNQGNANGSDRM